MNTVQTIVVDAVAWATLSAMVGLAAARRSAAAFDPTRLPWRTFGWECRVYERFGIRHWKDRLPEAGTMFGGMSKRRLPPGPGQLERYARETCRAELVHWLILMSYPIFLLWNTLLLGVAMIVYAVIANVPCIAIQRFNRARIRPSMRTVRGSVS